MKLNAFPLVMYNPWLQKLSLIMKLTTLIMLIVLLQCSARGFSQKISLNEINTPLKKVLRQINEQTGYVFFYDSQDINHKNVSIQLKDVTLNEALDECLKNQSLTYKVVDKTVVLQQKDPVVINKATNLAVAPVAISGQVLDDNNSPLIGVTIKLKGGNAVTISDASGKFSINVPDDKAVLIFSYVGFIKKELAVTPGKAMVVKLAPDLGALNEVVVTSLGIKREAKSLGYSVAKISTDNLNDIGSPINALTSLYGEAAGVKVTATALGPVGGVDIRIRNAVAMNQNSNTQPLFVIDGVPMVNGISSSSGFVSGGNVDISRGTGTGLNDLNIDDIESFEVLKGAKASVLYGAAGGNGVILITTKSASKKKKGFGVEANFTYSQDNPWIQEKLQNEFGSGFPVTDQDYTYGSNQDAQSFYLKSPGPGLPTQQAYAPTTYNFGPRFDGRQILWYDGVMRPYVAQPNNLRELYQTGHTNTANVAVQGGGPDGGVRFSYTHSDYEGIFYGFTQNSNNFNLNGNYKVTDNVQLKFVSTYSSTLTHNSPQTQVSSFVTYGIARDLDINLLKTQVVDPATGYNWFNVDNRTNLYSPGSITRGLADGYFFDQTQNSHNNSRNHFTNSLTLSVAMGKGLSLDVQGGFDWINTFAQDEDRVETPLSLSPGGGNYSIANTKDVAYNGQAILNYNTKFGRNFSLFTNIGAVAQATSDQYMLLGTNGGFLERDFFSLSNSVNPLLTTSSSRGSDRLYGALASAQLGYKEWLFVEFSGRNDFSSILPPQNNSYFYPGVSASWIFSDALKVPTWLDYGKLRASYANLGLPGPRYFSSADYTVGTYGGVTTFSPPGNLPPADLKPERRKELELGIETSFLKKRISLEFNYYQTDRYNAIIGLTLPPSSGYANDIINAGDIAQKGVELSLTGIPVLTKDFRWSVTLNADHDRPMVKSLTKGITQENLWGAIGANIVAATGQPWGQIMVNPYATDPKTGERLVSASGLYYQDETKQVVAGNVMPDIEGGFNNTISYKGFSLQFNIDYQFGSRLISETNMYLIGNGSSITTLPGRDAANGGLPYYVNSAGTFVRQVGNNPVPTNAQYGGTIFHDGVTLPGEAPDGTQNKVITGAVEKYAYYWQNFLALQPDVVYKNDYIKLRNAVFTYNLPKLFVNKLGLQKLAVSFFANNLVYLYKTMPNVDPESLNGTNVFYENNGDASTRSFGLSLKAAF